MIFKIGDIVKRLPNEEPFDPTYEPFQDGNDQFLILEISERTNSLVDIYQVLSLKNGTSHKIAINNKRLWKKIS